MKTSVFSVMAADYTAEELALKLKELGFNGIEWAVGYKNALWDKSKEWHLSEVNIEEEAKKLRDICKGNGLEICSLGTRVNCKEPERFKQVAKAANILNCKGLRIWVAEYNASVNYYDLYKETIAHLKTIQDICKDFKVKALLEIHGTSIIPSASSAIRILENFDSKYIGVIYDAGNMVQEGYEKWQMGMEILGKYLSHVHIKNNAWFLRETENGKKWFCTPTSLKDGIADYKEIVSALKNVGYNEWLSLEDFRGGWCCKPEGITTEEKLKEGLVYTKSLL
jgi:sugar phosphate isomerase/epimerase